MAKILANPTKKIHFVSNFIKNILNRYELANDQGQKQQNAKQSKNIALFRDALVYLLAKMQIPAYRIDKCTFSIE